MGLIQRVRERLTINWNLCDQCRSQPRRDDLAVPPDLARMLLVEPSRYCSVECAEEANARKAW